jgi:hypothetical protein
VLQPCVRRFLLAAEIAGKQPQGHADAADQVADRELEEGEVAAGADAGNGDDRERGGLGGDDGEQDRPGGEIPRAEEVVGGAALVAGDPEPYTERKDEVEADDDDVEAVQTKLGCWIGYW